MCEKEGENVWYVEKMRQEEYEKERMTARENYRKNRREIYIMRGRWIDKVRGGE